MLFRVLNPFEKNESPFQNYLSRIHAGLSLWSASAERLRMR